MKKSYTFDFSDSLKNDNTNNKIKVNNMNEEELIPGKHIIRNLINFSKSLGVFNSMSIGSFGLINN